MVRLENQGDRICPYYLKSMWRYADGDLNALVYDVTLRAACMEGCPFKNAVLKLGDGWVVNISKVGFFKLGSIFGLIKVQTSFLNDSCNLKTPAQLLIVGTKQLACRRVLLPSTQLRNLSILSKKSI